MIPAHSNGATSWSPKPSGKGVGVRLLVDHRVLRIPTVDVPAGEARREAQILVAGQAEPARAAGMGQPRAPRCDRPRASGWRRARAGRRHRPPRAPGVTRLGDAARGPLRPGGGPSGRRRTRARAHVYLSGPRFRNGLVDPQQRAVLDGAGAIDHPRLHQVRHRRQRTTRPRPCQWTFGPTDRDVRLVALPVQRRGRGGSIGCPPAWT